MRVNARRDQRSTLVSLSGIVHLVFRDGGLSLACGLLTELGWPVNSRGSAFPASPVLRLKHVIYSLLFKMWVSGWNSGLDAYVASV